MTQIGKKKVKRDPLDRYYTDQDCANAILNVLPIDGASRLLECAVGSGRFVGAIHTQSHRLATGYTVDGVDLDPDAPGLSMVSKAWIGDFFQVAHNHLKPEYDWVITNPPFKLAIPHVMKARTIGKNVAFLMRLAMLGAKERLHFWKRHNASYAYVLVERPEFDCPTVELDGSDSEVYAMFVWLHKDHPDYRDEMVTRHLSWK